MIKDLSKLSVLPSADIRDTIAAIDAGAKQIALVVDASGKLLGTATDGDIRRGELAKTFGTQSRPGLVEYLDGTALIAAAHLGPQGVVKRLTDAGAPLALAYERLTGHPLGTMSAIAVIATLNGIVVHMIMIDRKSVV